MLQPRPTDSGNFSSRGMATVLDHEPDETARNRSRRGQHENHAPTKTQPGRVKPAGDHLGSVGAVRFGKAILAGRTRLEDPS